MNTQSQTASDTLNGAAEKMKSDAASAVATARDAAAKLAETAKASAGEYAASGAQAFKDAVEEQKKFGAGAIGDVARSAKQAAEGFEQSSPQIAGAVRSVADRVESLSDDIRDRSVNELMASVTDFASKKPLAFFGCGILAGVVLARLLSNSER